MHPQFQLQSVYCFCLKYIKTSCISKSPTSNSVSVLVVLNTCDIIKPWQTQTSTIYRNVFFWCQVIVGNHALQNLWKRLNKNIYFPSSNEKTASNMHEKRTFGLAVTLAAVQSGALARTLFGAARSLALAHFTR